MKVVSELVYLHLKTAWLGKRGEKPAFLSFFFPTFRVLLWSGMSWQGPDGRQPQQAPLSGDHMCPFSLIQWSFFTSALMMRDQRFDRWHSPQLERMVFLFPASRDVLGAAIVLLCIYALLLSHILPGNLFFLFFFFWVITAGESLQPLWLEGNGCVCGVHYFRLE